MRPKDMMQPCPLHLHVISLVERVRVRVRVLRLTLAQMSVMEMQEYEVLMLRRPVLMTARTAANSSVRGSERSACQGSATRALQSQPRIRSNKTPRRSVLVRGCPGQATLPAHLSSNEGWKGGSTGVFFKCGLQCVVRRTVVSQPVDQRHELVPPEHLQVRLHHLPAVVNG